MKKLLYFGLTALMLLIAQMASAATTYYVTTNGTGNLSGADWANATNNLQGAIDAIEEGAANTVWVSNGVYETGGRINYPSGTALTNRVVIWKAITVRSANNDPANTIIKGAWDPATTNGWAAVRCVYMTNGSSLIGFMLTNGATLTTNESAVANDRYGGGLWGQSTNAVISNCVIAGNSADYCGGGACYITMYNCILNGNLSYYGGGMYGGNLYNCALVGNSSVNAGGGMLGGTLFNCTLIGNRGLNGGGMAYASPLFNCMIVSNSAVNGGGTFVSGGTVNYYNCTIVSNSASGFGGGAGINGGLGIFHNCIIYNNNSPAGSNYFVNLGTFVFTNSCTAPTATVWSAGNITDNPMFIDKDTGNYRLSVNSPCVNTGTNMTWMNGASDLDGHRRIDRFSGIVDMGAYETIYKGTIYLIGF